MHRQDFSYELPVHLIAREPPAERGDSRLLVLDGPSGQWHDSEFGQLPQWLRPGDLLVFNDTKVIPARVFGQKTTGGQVEILVERVVSTQRVLAHVRASKSPRPGSVILLGDGTEVSVEGRAGELFMLEFAPARSALEVLEAVGQMPLPPYIDRAVTDADKERYQTVYSRNAGAVAAPTAGLHFTKPLLEQLAVQGVEQAFVTLHVGAGTFQPVRADDIRQHHMHSELMVLDDSVCAKVAATKARGGRVIAVGTTSVRCLETAAQGGELKPYQGDTNIFIYPSYRYRVVDALVTNFHLPESTLLMLVCAFAGYQHTLQAYRHAVAAGYRFFSYGDAMFITHNPAAISESLPPSQ